ncbi:MAG: fibronectin type III domain-containing protein, partial [Nitrososphaerales archaeon]
MIIPFYAEGQSSTVPAAPTLTATVISSSQINLSWTTPSNGGSSITGYKIEYKIIPATDYSTLVQISGNTITTYSHTGLQSDKYYVYHIAAINSVGTSEWSTEALGQTKPPQNIAPNPPTSLTAKAVSPTQINLSWTAPTYNGGPSVTGYKIEEKVGNSYTTIVTNTGNTNTSYSRTSLITGTTYTYRVLAINSVGTSPPSNEAFATPTSTSSITVPSPPTNLSAAKVSQTQVDLSWNAPSDNGGSAITGYKIEEKVGTGSFTAIVPNTGNTNTSYSRTGLTAGTTYTYRVFAMNSAGTSSPSNEVTSSQTINAVPNPPTNLVVASASPTQLNLSWRAPSDNGGPAVTGYKIEVKSGSNSYAVLVSNTGSVTSYSHSGLTTGTTYTYRVLAIN